MSAAADDVKSIFGQALERPDPVSRAAYLAEACGENASLRAEVEGLLAAMERAGDFLNRAPNPTDATQTFGNPAATGSFRPAPSAAETEGMIIAGRYKLRQQIGEGGMGTVWMADQTEPVKRKVAVKLIRVERGQSKTILARFEAERQAIALMDHPHIAKLLDAGTTETGAPFFIMELVKGIPLNDYCDQQKLTIPERLHLFTQICGAVQHAHQKGVIHRDLKPGNILVESHDGKPVPKVIDFGLAKATTGLQLTEQSLFTAFGSVMGTPLYMAPEQASFNAVDVDTRADVYALGVILYELLTGSTPITRDSLKKAALDEMLRLVREQEAPTPSSRLSSADSLPNVSANRQIEPQKLGRFVKGELDWIVLKALSKERDRRYETANGFAQDIERFLNHEPVQAGPVTAAYRLNKFVRRNRPQVIAASLLLCALLAGIAGTTLGLIEAKKQERLAVAAADEERLAKQEAVQQQERAETNQKLAAERLVQVEAEKQKAVEFRNKALDALRATTGEDVEKLLGEKKELTKNEKAYLEAIVWRWQTFARQEGTDEQSRAIAAEGHFRVANLWMKLGRREEALPGYNQAIAPLEKLAADFPAVPDYLNSLAASHTNLGNLLAGLGKGAEAEEQCRKGLALFEKLADDFPAVPDYRSAVAANHSNLGTLLADLGKQAEAEEQSRKGLAIDEKLAADFPADPDYRRGLAGSHNNLGIMMGRLGKWVEAEEHFRKGLAIQEKLAADFPAATNYFNELALSLSNLGFLLVRLGKPAEAEVLYRKGLAINEKLAADFPAVPDYRSDLAMSNSNLGRLLSGLGKQTEAEEQYRKALTIQEKLAADFPAVPNYRVLLGFTYSNFGSLVRDGGKPADSLAWFDKAIETIVPVHQAEPKAWLTKEFLKDSHACRARAYDALGRHAEAVKDWDRAIALSPPAGQPGLYAGRAATRMKAGVVAEAVADLAKLTPSPSPDGHAEQWVAFTRAYSLAGGKVTNKKQDYTDRAMEFLEKAVKAGFMNAAHMKTDTDLDPLREREDFKKLLAELEKKFPPKPEAPKTPEKK